MSSDMLRCFWAASFRSPWRPSWQGLWATCSTSSITTSEEEEKVRECTWRGVRVCRSYELTADWTVHVAAAVQQVVSQARCVCQAEKILEFICGKTCVLCSFSQVNNSPWQALFGHLPLKYPLLKGAWVEAIKTRIFKSVTTRWIFLMITYTIYILYSCLLWEDGKCALSFSVHLSRLEPWPRDSHSKKKKKKVIINDEEGVPSGGYDCANRNMTTFEQAHYLDRAKKRFSAPGLSNFDQQTLKARNLTLIKQVISRGNYLGGRELVSWGLAPGAWPGEA